MPKCFRKFPGSEKKTAERIIIELKDKIGPGGVLEAHSAQRALSAEEQRVNDAVLALMALGYKPAEAHEAIRATQALLGPAAGVEELVRAGLRKGA
jgi:Holliday junction DNA helicase RuvA